MKAAEEFIVSDPDEFKIKAFSRATGEEYACFLDSNDHQEGWTDFDCLIGWGSKQVFRPEENCFTSFQAFLDNNPGWKIGFLGYDLKNETEALSSENADPMAFPALCFFVPSHLLILKGTTLRILSDTDPARLFDEIGRISPLTAPEASPSLPQIEQRTSRDDYLNTVAKIRRHIIDGDVYELNYCLDFYAGNYLCDPGELFLRLNRQAPAPFASFLKMGSQYILCASPERFLRKTGNKIISQPIKGTIRRGSTPAEDKELKIALRSSEKEMAENVMIVDLVRNDISRSAVPGSVRVTELFGIRSFRHWHQMVSTVEGIIKPELRPVEIIRNAFPMGSMTGAPKIMAMKLIERYEQFRRGAYSGALGYFTPDGDFDLNVIIRTMCYDSDKKHLSFPAGSAITHDAIAENEYEECLLKAKAIRNLLNPAS